MCYSPIFLLLVCRTHRVTHAWCTAACTGVLYVRSIGRWRDIYPVILPCPWPLLILLQFKRWMQVETRKLHRLLKMAPNTPPWRYSLCRICLLLYTELKTAFLSLFFLGYIFVFWIWSKTKYVRLQDAWWYQKCWIRRLLIEILFLFLVIAV